jgi:hypothetical protein
VSSYTFVWGRSAPIRFVVRRGRRGTIHRRSSRARAGLCRGGRRVLPGRGISDPARDPAAPRRQGRAPSDRRGVRGALPGGVRKAEVTRLRCASAIASQACKRRSEELAIGSCPPSRITAARSCRWRRRPGALRTRRISARAPCPEPASCTPTPASPRTPSPAVLPREPGPPPPPSPRPGPPPASRTQTNPLVALLGLCVAQSGLPFMLRSPFPRGEQQSARSSLACAKFGSTSSWSSTWIASRTARSIGTGADHSQLVPHRRGRRPAAHETSYHGRAAAAPRSAFPWCR